MSDLGGGADIGGKHNVPLLDDLTHHLLLTGAHLLPQTLPCPVISSSNTHIN